MEESNRIKGESLKGGRGSMGSQGNQGVLDEFLKRKREESEEIDLRGRSKKVVVEESTEREGTNIGIILQEIREMRREGNLTREELKSGLEGIRNEMEKRKKEMKLKEEKWEREREEMKRRIEKLEKDLKEGSKIGILEERMGRLERGAEKEERQKRRKNLIFKGIRGEKGKIKEDIEEICRNIGAEIEIENVREIRAGNEGKGKMVLVRLKTEEDKRKILENKRKIKKKEIWIEEDLTFGERKMKWKLRQIMEEEERKGEKVKVGYGKIWIGNELWFWDEEMEELKNRGGRKREKNGNEERKWGEEIRGN